MAADISIQDEENCYEGTEKLLEMWFFNPSEDEISLSSPKSLHVRKKLTDKRKYCSLLDIERCEWDRVMGVVRCEILNVIERDGTAAFLLSESSMFLTENCLILKTCGRTTPLAAVQMILELAAGVGLTRVGCVFYSRKNFRFPDLQLPPYQSFLSESQVLMDAVPGGGAHCLGRLNGDHWYLYIKETHHALQSGARPKVIDQTLEMLMTNLPAHTMSQFFQSCKNKQDIHLVFLKQLWPELNMDEKTFSPCGYSMNGLFPGGKYLTIHVTPEEESSYVSVETNLILGNYHEVMMTMIDFFQPGRFCATLFSQNSSPYGLSSVGMGLELGFPGYSEVDRTVNVFKMYNVTFVSFHDRQKVR